MEEYDPEFPAMEGSYFFFVLAPVVNYNLSAYLKHGDLLLALNKSYVGKMSCVCNKLFCQSKLLNGIIKVETPLKQILGHLVLVQNTAYHFIPYTYENNGFAIDNQILYKRETNIQCQVAT